MLYFTCKHCCTLTKEHVACPVCEREDSMESIVIHIQNATKSVVLDFQK